MRGELLKQEPDSALSRHLLFMSQLKEDQVYQTQTVQVGKGSREKELINEEAEKMLVKVKQSSKLKACQRVEVVSGDGSHTIASFGRKDIENGFGLTAFYASKAIVRVTQPA